MNFLKKIAIASALSSIAFAASAMTPIADADLSQVSGQDGVSIAANLNVNIGSFTYTNTSTGGGSVGFNNIAITGTIAATLDVISQNTFAGSAYVANSTTPNAPAGALLSVLGLSGVSSSVTTAAATTAVTAAGNAAYAANLTAGGTTTTAAVAAAAAVATASAAGGAGQLAAVAAAASTLNAFYNGGDVVAIAVPNLTTTNSLNVKVGSITMGVNGVQTAGAASFGAIAMNNIQLQGTTAYIWAH